MCAVSDLSDERAIKRLQDGDNYIRIIKDCDPAQYHLLTYMELYMPGQAPAEVDEINNYLYQCE